MSDRQTAIVTGASSGIGRALAERAARAGWNVVAVGRRAERLGELAIVCEGAPGSIATLALDLRSPQAAERIVAEALHRFGRIDVLVNNAGGTAVGRITAQSDEALREQVETHVVVPLALAREALPSLRAVRGRIFFLGSGVARIPVAMLGAYPPAKAAVRSMARVARNELRSSGVGVTYVDPGAVASEFMTRVGYAGAPPGVAASPERVAERIFRAFTKRRAVVNAVPWQTTVVALAEKLPNITDWVLSRFPQIVLGEARRDARPRGRAGGAPAEPVLRRPPATATADMPPFPIAGASPRAPQADAETEPPFRAALAEQRGRMRKLNLSETFVRALLVPGARLELGDVAMRWAGMPNKNERALTGEVFAALAAAGYVERGDGDAYRVLRAAEPE